MKRIVHAVGRAFLTLFFGIPPVKQIADRPVYQWLPITTPTWTPLILYRLFPLNRVNRVKVIAAQDYFGRGIGGFLGRRLFNLILLDRRATRRC